MPARARALIQRDRDEMLAAAPALPGAETWFFPGEGHALRERYIEDVHAWLVDCYR
jgi:hypothetical protein